MPLDVMNPTLAMAWLSERLTATNTYVQLAIALILIALAWLITLHPVRSTRNDTPLWQLIQRATPLLFPLTAVLLLFLGAAISKMATGRDWVLRTFVILMVLVVFERFINLAVAGPVASRLLRWIGIPLITLQMLDLLGPLSTTLDLMAVEVGNLRITVNGVLRVLIFGSLLFWLGWVSNHMGQDIIRRQERLDLRTREVVAKLFQIGLGVIVALLFLQVMGINLTALAVFGGAIGVGLGFGLQSIASNFISGIIILFDRSLSVGDFVEIEDGKSGYVRELKLRYTTLESFDGKVVLVPNDTFISSAFINWTHRNRKQRYRVDFSVAYKTDVRTLCDLIRATVAEHPQVISGPDIPFEERPDCEIDSFGDNGVNMFVEFWMDGVDDGKNRVGGDLLLMILETLQKNGIEIPFPQREVRMLPS